MKKEGFNNYIDILGKEHFDLYMKNVDANELDVIYKESFWVKYKGEYFELFSDKIFKEDVLDNSYMIWTPLERLAHQYMFEKKEQFVFVKYISKEEMEAIKIVMKPILEFEGLEQQEEIMEGDVLDKWLSELL